ncbi:hypothetical protein MKZ38_006824 [Zalerion maritima]|uniref:Uncharacterized protein n=1 Tax=Zalerion maritima TaxID=339359 RepID=A0AAD5WW66_9PEZI|nr:hypothetical protein MKZ38_006824 [Zalerion maritima]
MVRSFNLNINLTTVDGMNVGYEATVDYELTNLLGGGGHPLRLRDGKILPCPGNDCSEPGWSANLMALMMMMMMMISREAMARRMNVVGEPHRLAHE